MIARLILFVFAYALAGTFVAAPIAIALLPSFRRWRRRQLGRRNARLLSAHDGETCFECLRPVDPQVDLYDDRRGWHHIDCYRKLLGETE